MISYLERLFERKEVKFVLNNINWFSIIAWGAISFYVIFFVISFPGSNTITPMYWRASTHWLEGTELYFRKGFNVNSGYCYFPQAAILNIPLALLPFTVAEVIWRVLNIALLIWGCICVTKLTNLKPAKITFFVISVATIAVSYDSIRNGQFNLILISLMCFIVYLIEKKKFKSAIILCILGGAIKPYLFIPMILLCGVFPRKCIVTAVIGTIIFAIIPYLTQNPEYVTKQYITYRVLLEKRNAMGIEEGFANLFGVVNYLYFWAGVTMQFIVSVIVGIAVYLYCLYFKFYKKQYLSMIILFTICSYILLFSSRTEFNTYCFAGPVIGYIIAEAIFLKKYYSSIFLTICWVLVFSAHAIVDAVTPDAHCMWMAPLAYTVFFVYALIRIIPEFKTHTVE